MSAHEQDQHTDVAELIRRIDVSAPPELHQRVARMVADSGRRRRELPLRPALAGGVVLALALAIALVVAFVPGGGSRPGQPQLLQASARLALANPAGAAPAEDPRGGGRLLAAVEGVTFPYWRRSLGWHATGTRSATIDGRAVMTVYYADGRGLRVGYSILGGEPAPTPRGGTLSVHHGIPYRFLRLAGADAVVWLREGRLCVIAGHGIDRATLLRLASWQTAPLAAAA